MSFFLEERRQDILNWILEHGRVSVSELSGRYNVSEVTIRNDLQALENQQLLMRTHGGAIATAPEYADINLNKRLDSQVEEKSRIGITAASRVSAGETIFLDSSTTALAIARNIKYIPDLTVVTNSLTITQELMDVPGISILLTGGLVLRDDASTYGWAGIDFLQKVTIQKGFFGAHGIDLTHGLTDLSPVVADVKKSVLTRCKEVIAVVDATKWGKVGLTTFATLDQVNLVVTTQDAPSDLVKQVSETGIRVLAV